MPAILLVRIHVLFVLFFKKQYYATSSTFLENANKNGSIGPGEGSVSRILRTALYTIWERLTNETILNRLTFFKMANHNDFFLSKGNESSSNCYPKQNIPCPQNTLKWPNEDQRSMTTKEMTGIYR